MVCELYLNKTIMRKTETDKGKRRRQLFTLTKEIRIEFQKGTFYNTEICQLSSSIKVRCK